VSPELLCLDLLSLLWDFLKRNPMITHKTATNTGVRDENTAMVNEATQSEGVSQNRSSVKREGLT